LMAGVTVFLWAATALALRLLLIANTAHSQPKPEAENCPTADALQAQLQAALVSTVKTVFQTTVQPILDSYRGQLCNTNNNKTCDCKCAGLVQLSPEAKNAVLIGHNHPRSQLAMGLAQRGGATRGVGIKMPSGRNMYALEYDDELACFAQKWVNKCILDQSSGTPDTGENSWWSGGKPMLANKAMSQACALWYKEGQDNDMTNGVTMEMGEADFPKIGHWSQMIWGASTRIGCGLNWCPALRRTLVVCLYREPGNYLDERLYEPGPPCQSAADCTTFGAGNSTCDISTRLCHRLR